MLLWSTDQADHMLTSPKCPDLARSPQIHSITPAMSDQSRLHSAPRSPYTTIAIFST